MKLKPLLPTLKEKKRYLAFEIISNGVLNADSVAKSISNNTLQFLGTLDSGEAGIMFLKDKYANNTGIIKTNHKYVDKTRTALGLIKEIDNKDVVFRTKIVSGTLKKAMLKFNQAKKAEV